MLATLVLMTALGAHTLAVQIEGSIDATMEKTAPEHGAALSSQVARLLRWRGKPNSQVHRGDKVAVLFDDTGLLLALEYQGLELKEQAYLYRDHLGRERYYAEDGRLLEPVMQKAPVPNYWQITETVQNHRGDRRHRGVDLKAPIGATVVSPRDGTITRLNWHRGANGLCVELTYADGLRARFLHMSKVEPLHVGQSLKMGAELGKVGTTGHSTAPHLHYELVDGNDKPQDPLKYHGTKALRLSDLELTEFQKARAAADLEFKRLSHGA